MFKIFNRKKRDNKFSILHALAEVLTSAELQKVALHSTDWRELPDVAIEQLRLDKIKLSNKLAELLNLPVLHNIPIADLNACRPDAPVSLFRRSGAIPITQAGSIVGIACVDPARLRKLTPHLADLPLHFALWSTIAQSLEESEAVYRKVLEQQSKQNDYPGANERSIALRILEMLVLEVESHSQRSTTLEFTSNEIVYQFITADKRTGTGFIDGRIGNQIRTLLLEKNRSANGIELLIQNKLKIIDVIVLPAGTDITRIMLSWDSTQKVPDLESREPETVSNTLIKTEPTAVKSELSKDLESNLLLFNQENNQKVTTPQSTPSILIVDDNKTFLTVLRRFFDKRGVSVEEYGDAQYALADLQSGKIKPEIIICDVHMPGITGIQLLKEIRAKPELAETPVIMLTSDDDTETEVRAISSGADAYIYKHLDSRILFAHVERFLKRKIIRAA